MSDERDTAEAPRDGGSLMAYATQGDQGDSATDFLVPAKGRPSVHSEGILYQGSWTEPSNGFQEHVRRCAEALAGTGCPVHLRSLTGGLGSIDDEVERRMAPLVHASIGRYSLMVQQVVPLPGFLSSITTARRDVPQEIAEDVAASHAALNARRILSTVWERTSGLSADDVLAMNSVAEVWVACLANVKLLESSGVTTPIRIVQVPYSPNDPHLSLSPTRERPPGPVVFYHVGKWEARKAQDIMLDAFCAAFQPGEAHFYIKTSPNAPPMPGYPRSASEAIAGTLKTAAAIKNGWTAENVGGSIFVTPKTITEKQMLDLHRRGHIYVSTSHGEGFDMPAFDAKLSGNLLLYTPSGGPQDYATANDELVPANGTVRANPFYRWGNAEYIDFRTEEVARGMRNARDKVTSGLDATLGIATLSSFSSAEVGWWMRFNLDEIAERLGTKVA